MSIIGTTWLAWRAEKYETFPAALERATAAFVERHGYQPTTVIVSPQLGDLVTPLAVLVRPTVAAGEMMIGPIRPVEG